MKNISLYLFPIIFIVSGILMDSFTLKDMDLIMCYSSNRARRNEYTWEAANKFFGRFLRLLGIISLIISIVLYIVYTRIGIDISKILILKILVEIVLLIMYGYKTEKYLKDKFGDDEKLLKEINDTIYDVNLKIDVYDGMIDADANIIFLLDNKCESMNFYIHKNLEVYNVVCNKKISYEASDKVSNWSKFISESKQIKIKFEEEINEKEAINITIKYKGNIRIVSEYGINRITEEWVELGIYSPCYPLFEDFRKCKFKVKIDITEGYKVVNAQKVYDNYVIKNDTPSVDFTVIASNKFKKFSVNLESMNINIYYLEDNQRKKAYEIYSCVFKIIKLYRKFGKIDLDNVSIVNLPRSNGGGYCRENLIVLNETNTRSEIDIFNHIAHELAHLWWHNADTNSYEDWLNESFAEFSALLAIKEVYGEAEYNKKISRYKEESCDAPSIIGLDRKDERAYKCLYRKGPVILNGLMKTIGEDMFMKLFSEIQKYNITTTDELLKLIENLTTINVAEEFDINLR